MERSGFRLPVVELGVTYRAAARFGDVVSVTCRLEDLASRAARFGYSVEGEGRVLAEGFTRHVCCDRDGRAVALPRRLREQLEAASGRRIE